MLAKPTLIRDSTTDHITKSNLYACDEGTAIKLIHPNN